MPTDERVERAAKAMERCVGYFTYPYDGGVAICSDNHEEYGEFLMAMARAALAAAAPDDDAVERAARAIFAELDGREDWETWDVLPEEWKDGHRRQARAALTAADTAPEPGLDELRLRGQVKYLRDYAISKAAEVVTASNGGNLPTREQLSSLIGGIDGNIAVAGERAIAAVITPDDEREGGGAVRDSQTFWTAIAPRVVIEQTTPTFDTRSEAEQFDADAVYEVTVTRHERGVTEQQQWHREKENPFFTEETCRKVFGVDWQEARASIRLDGQTITEDEWEER